MTLTIYKLNPIIPRPISLCAMQETIRLNTSLVFRLREKRPGNFHEFKLYLYETSRQLHDLIHAMNVESVHVIVMIFPAAENGAFLIIEATLCCKFCKRGQTQVLCTIRIMYTSVIKACTKYRIGMTTAITFAIVK